MRFERKLAALGAGCLVLFLLATFPARLAFMVFSPTGIDSFGVTGTLWNGSARIINAGETIQLRNTEWDLALTQLLRARLGADVKTRWNGGFLEGFVSTSALGNVAVRDTTASLDIQVFQSLFNTPPINGQFSVQIDELDVRNNWPVLLIGSGKVLGFSSSLMGSGSASVIGDIGIDFAAADNGNENINGRIEDLGGPLEISGTLVLSEPSDYSINTRIKARPDASEALRRNLEFLGPAEPDGARVFELAGSI